MKLISLITTLVRQIRCKHKSQQHVRNIHGDEINRSPGRSLWRCDACGKSIYHKELKEGGYSHAQALVDEAKAAIRSSDELWSRRWYGSPPQEGWSIMRGRTEIAVLGKGVSEHAVDAIIDAHNSRAT